MLSAYLLGIIMYLPYLILKTANEIDIIPILYIL